MDGQGAGAVKNGKIAETDTRRQGRKGTGVVATERERRV